MDKDDSGGPEVKWYPLSVRISDDPEAKNIWDRGYYWDTYQRRMHERAAHRQKYGWWPKEEEY
jgi:hypothetical protein